MALELFNNGKHKCVVFTDLVQGEGVQANQFLIVDEGVGMLLDPGGNLTYKNLLAEMANHFLPAKTQYIFASHQDPDIIASANGWLLITNAKILIAQEWARFLPHFCSKGVTTGRIVIIPPHGMNVILGNSNLKIIPAHFLHTVGFFQIYDPISKILFSGDVGASLVEDASLTVQDFDQHLINGHMENFHRRYMCNNKACRLWVQMVRQLDIEWIVPQHGMSFKGKLMIQRFLEWLENLVCGTDLLSAADYQIPE